ncbi:MAG: MmgE/PrpD family protein [Hyphomicrobiales bacterium]|nr:MmgE/PrpD family protein [Hyphomicrobiales bacterium]
MSVLRTLSAFVTQASASALPETERVLLRRHVADTLVAAAAGARSSEGRALRRALPRETIADAAGLIAAVVRHTEIDDIHTRSCTTPSSVTVPTALALARALAVDDPNAVASAIWIGTELMTRLGVAVDGARVLYRGLWPTYFTAPLGSAAVTARLLRLDETQTAHALSLAMMLMAGRSGRFHGTLPGRSVILAIAVANGVRAAQAAGEGVGGDPTLLDGPWLADAHGIAARIDALTEGLGQGSIYPQMSLKPFCTAKQALAAIEAFTMIRDGGVTPDAISRIAVRVPPPYSRMIAIKPEAGVRASTIVSAAYQIGLAAHRNERLFDIERADAMNETAVLALASKVEIESDETLASLFPQTFPAEVEVVAAGAVRRQRVTAAAGDPGRALDEAALRAKAERVLSFLPGATAASRLIDIGLAGSDSRHGCRALVQALWDNAVES